MQRHEGAREDARQEDSVMDWPSFIQGVLFTGGVAVLFWALYAWCMVHPWERTP